MFKILAVGALLATAVSTFTGLIGQPRIFFRMSRDGLFAPLFGKLNPKTGVPTMGVIIIAIFTSLIALFVPIDSLADVISLGSLYAFSVVDCGILLFRYGDGSGGRRSIRLCIVLGLFLAGCLGAAISLLQLQVMKKKKQT